MQDSINRTLPGYVVDSILPVEEQLRRFRAVDSTPPVKMLQHSSPSRDALVHRFLSDLQTSDTVDLRQMLVTRGEFADLVYPESPYTHPPYRQDPALVWTTIQNPSATGFLRLLRRVAGVKAESRGYSCEPIAKLQGKNKLWSECQLKMVGPSGDVSLHRLFGSILEREGKFKFLSYKNEF